MPCSSWRFLQNSFVGKFPLFGWHNWGTSLAKMKKVQGIFNMHLSGLLEQYQVLKWSASLCDCSTSRKRAGETAPREQSKCELQHSSHFLNSCTGWKWTHNASGSRMGWPWQSGCPWQGHTRPWEVWAETRSPTVSSPNLSSPLSPLGEGLSGSLDIFSLKKCFCRTDYPMCSMAILQEGVRDE